MSKFIYVFNDNDKQALLDMNYDLLKCDIEQGIYIFANKPQKLFSAKGIAFALSDTLTF